MERIVVATIHHPDRPDEVHDEAWSWETGQNYANQGYIVKAVTNDGFRTKQDCQDIYDAERAAFMDCFGRSTPFGEDE
jgi:hypothetical protein